jgi:hypothetical protein
MEFGRDRVEVNAVAEVAGRLAEDGDGDLRPDPDIHGMNGAGEGHPVKPEFLVVSEEYRRAPRLARRVGRGQDHVSGRFNQLPRPARGIIHILSPIEPSSSQAISGARTTARSVKIQRAERTVVLRSGDQRAATCPIMP